MKKLVSTLVLGGLLSAPGFAMAAQEGFYIGAGFGQSKLHDWVSKQDMLDELDATASYIGVTSFNGSVSTSSSDTDTAWKLLAGFQIDPIIAIEAAYVDFGAASAKASATGSFTSGLGNINGTLAEKLTGEAQAISVDVVGKIPVTSWLDAYVAGGGYHSNAKFKLTASIASNIGNDEDSDSKSKSSSGFHFGVGAEATPMKNVSVRVEWERFNRVRVYSSFNVDLISASALYHF